MNEDDRIIGISSMCFDLSVYDIFGALSTGAMLVMIRDPRDMQELIRTVERRGLQFGIQCLQSWIWHWSK